MKIGSAATIVLASALLAACTVFDPYVSQPVPHATYTGAIAGLDGLQSDLTQKVRSETLLGAATGAGILVGIGGAGIATVFHAASATVLAFSAFGVSSYAVNNLYGSRSQAAIYNAGLDAVACVRVAIAPIADLHAALTADGTSLAAYAAAITAWNMVNLSDPERAYALSIRDDAIAAQGVLPGRLAQDDRQASTINTAVQSIVSTLNTQLATVVPDAAALARAGSSLSGQIIGGAAAGTPTANAANAPPKPGGALGTSVTTTSDANLNALLAATSNLMVQTNADITKTATVTTVSCKVANATAAAPISVNIPGGGTSISYQAAKQQFSISGGSGFYVGPSWITPTPPSFASVQVTNVPSGLLVIGPGNGPTPVAGSSYVFDIYDALGNHLATPITLTVPASAQQPAPAPAPSPAPAPAPAGLTQTGASGNALALPPRSTATLKVSGGTAPYTASVVKGPDGNVIAKAADPSSGTVTVTVAAGAAGTYVIGVSDTNKVKLATNVTVTVQAAPVTTISQLPDSVTVGNAATLNMHLTGVNSAGCTATFNPPIPNTAVTANCISDGVDTTKRLLFIRSDVTAPGTYSLQVADAGGSRKTITVNASP